MVSESLFIVPNAKETKLQLETDRSLLMRVNAPPVKGKANREITKWLSKKLRRPSSHIRIVAGLASNLKTLEITGIDEGSFLEAIGQRRTADPGHGPSDETKLPASS